MIGVLYHGGKSYLDYGVIRLRKTTSPQINLDVAETTKDGNKFGWRYVEESVGRSKREKASYNKNARLKLARQYSRL